MVAHSGQPTPYIHNTTPTPNSFHTELRWGSGCDNTIPPNSFHTELHWGNCCAIGLASLKSRFRTEKYTCLLCPMSIQMYMYISMLLPLCTDVKKTDAQLVTCSLSTQQSTVSVVSVRTTSTAMWHEATRLSKTCSAVTTRVRLYACVY